MTTASGNAYDDGAERRGWLIGHFIDPDTSPLHSTDVEIKWGTHQAGEERHEWTVAEEEVRTTMVMLLRGHFAVRLPDGDQEMKREGDFVVFGPGTSHSWQAFDDSIVLTVRWPSVVLGGASAIGCDQGRGAGAAAFGEGAKKRLARIKFRRVEDKPRELFGLSIATHVVLWIVVGLAVVSMTLFIFWISFDKPHLQSQAAKGVGPEALFNAAKLALAVVAGIGGVVALVVAFGVNVWVNLIMSARIERPLVTRLDYSPKDLRGQPNNWARTKQPCELRESTLSLASPTTGLLAARLALTCYAPICECPFSCVRRFPNMAPICSRRISSGSPISGRAWRIRTLVE